MPSTKGARNAKKTRRRKQPALKGTLVGRPRSASSGVTAGAEGGPTAAQYYPLLGTSFAGLLHCVFSRSLSVQGVCLIWFISDGRYLFRWAIVPNKTGRIRGEAPNPRGCKYPLRADREDGGPKIA